jgi:hypothetical protein
VNVIGRASSKLSEEELKNALGDLSVKSCLDGVQNEVVDAQKVLESHKLLNLKNRAKFVFKRANLQEVFISMVLICLLMDGIMSASSHSPLAEVMYVSPLRLPVLLVY